MQLNFDVIREVLLYIEKNTGYVEAESKLQPMIIQLSKLVEEEKCSSVAEALYVVRKLDDGGYIITNETLTHNAEKLSDVKTISELCIMDITFKGTEFLNLIRDSIVWERYKHNFPAISFENITQIIPKMIIEYYS